MTGTLLGNHPVAVIGLAAATAAYAALHRLGASYGSTKQERRTELPGDEIVRKPQFTVTHAITIDVPSEQVWPWLVQMGWHRGGWQMPQGRVESVLEWEDERGRGLWMANQLCDLVQIR